MEPLPLSSVVTDLVARHYLKKPDQAELLRIKFPDLESLGHAALNELAFRLKLDRSFRLTTLNVEITNRCNLRCSYCPVNRDLQRPKRDLPLAAFQDLLRRAPSVRTLLPFQWGEPLLHPQVFEMIRFASQRGIRTYLTTNGTLLDGAAQAALIDSGLARLTVSVDGDDEVHERSRGTPLAPIRERVLALKRRRDAAGAALRIDASMVLDADTAPGRARFVAAWSPVVDRVQVIPRMLPGQRTSACREPWRGLLVVLADGKTTACCADSEGALDLGNAFERDPAEIFSGEPLRALRRAHATGSLPAPCATCTEFRHPEVSARFA